MKKRSLRVIVLLLLVVVSMTSCQRDTSVRTALARAEALMESDPHAARAVLDSLENVLRRPSTLSRQPSSPRLSKSDAALYALLRMQADYKCDVPLTSDSLARVATDYYGMPRCKNYHAAMAWYTLGCVYTDKQEDSKAISAYLKACDCFPDTTSRYYPLTLQNLGRHYLNRNMLAEATSAFTRFGNLSESIGESNLLAFARYYLGFTRLLQFDYETADSLFDLLLDSDTFRASYMAGAFLHKAKIAFYSKDDHLQAFAYLRNYRKVIQADSLLAPVFV